MNIDTLKIFNKYILQNILDNKDIVKYSTGKKIKKVFDPFIEKIGLNYFSENTLIQLIITSINLSTVVYQYMYATWFMYFTTTFSGSKKIIGILGKNPLFSLMFYLSFYFKILGESDASKINLISDNLGLPSYKNTLEYQRNLILKVFEKVGIQSTNIDEYNFLKLIPKFDVSIRGTDIVFSKLSSKTLDSLFSENIKELQVKPKAWYKSERDNIEFDDSEIQEFYDKLKENPKFVKKLKKLKFKNTICLDDCKQRMKTNSGCYCSSDCSPTLYGKRKWCYVDEASCKNKLDKTLLGYTFDYCDKYNVSKKKCFTGIKYEDCEKI